MLTLLAIPLAILYECWTNQLLGDTAIIAVVLLSTISDRGAAKTGEKPDPGHLFGQQQVPRRFESPVIALAADPELSRAQHTHGPRPASRRHVAQRIRDRYARREA